ncbi:MAG: inner membrane CreD family protein [Bacteroidota bacterium]
MQDDVIREVSAKWSGSQTLSGPVLVVPYKAKKKIDHGKEGGIEIIDYVGKYYFLPESLDIKGEVYTTHSPSWYF